MQPTAGGKSFFDTCTTCWRFGRQRARVLVADVLYVDKEGEEVLLSLSLSLT